MEFISYAIREAMPEPPRHHAAHVTRARAVRHHHHRRQVNQYPLSTPAGKTRYNAPQATIRPHGITTRPGTPRQPRAQQAHLTAIFSAGPDHHHGGGPVNAMRPRTCITLRRCIAWKSPCSVRHGGEYSIRARNDSRSGRHATNMLTQSPPPRQARSSWRRRDPRNAPPHRAGRPGNPLSWRRTPRQDEPHTTAPGRPAVIRSWWRRPGEARTMNAPPMNPVRQSHPQQTPRQRPRTPCTRSACRRQPHQANQVKNSVIGHYPPTPAKKHRPGCPPRPATAPRHIRIPRPGTSATASAGPRGNKNSRSCRPGQTDGGGHGVNRIFMAAVTR